MAKGDVFEKPWVDERDKNNLEGVLEQLNLPPRIITFVKENKRVVQAATVAIIVMVVAWALYGSYRESKIEKASMALAQAETLQGQQLIDELGKVAEQYAGTDSALWADIARAHELASLDKTAEARQIYIAMRERTSGSSPLFPLLTYGIGQTSEKLADYQQAVAAYQTLKTTPGYIHVGIIGLGRLSEEQGDKAGALRVYEAYLKTLGDTGNASQRRLVEEKVASLKATL